MVQPKLRDRFKSAKEALLAFSSINLTANSDKDISLYSLLTEPTGKLNFTVVALTAMFGLFVASVLAIIIAIDKIEFSLVNLAIAIIGAVAIVIIEMGIIEIAIVSEVRKKKSKITGIAVAIPTLVVIVAGFILGIQEAIAICCALVLAQTLTFAYFLLDYLQLKGFSSQNNN